jgi:hypothetical protein
VFYFQKLLSVPWLAIQRIFQRHNIDFSYPRVQPSTMTGHFRSSQSLASFPSLPQFSEFMKPCRFEGEIQHLEVQGEIPPEIDGTFYRVMPDPQFPPFVENDPVCSPLRMYRCIGLPRKRSGSMATAISVPSESRTGVVTSSNVMFGLKSFSVSGRRKRRWWGNTVTSTQTLWNLR